MSARLAALALVLALPRASSALPPGDPSSRPPLHHLPAPEPHPREPLYVGEYLGLGVGARLPGSRLLLSARISTLLQIVDAEVNLVGDPIPREVGVRLNVHPLFVALIWRNIWGLLAAGAHGWAAMGAGRYEVGGAIRWGLPLELGAGLDLPLTSLEHTSGLWITARLGTRWLEVGAIDRGGSYVEAALGWRWYDLRR